MNSKQNINSITNGAEFHESLANNWSASYESGGFRRRIVFFESLLKRIVCPDDLWLDAGCGSGRLARLIGQLGAEVVAVDGSPAMIECARNESNDMSDRITYTLVGTIETLDFQSSSFGHVLCSSVIEYVEEPEIALGELFRVIRPSGLLILSVPNRFSVIRLVQKLLRRAYKVFEKDVYSYLSVSKNEYSSAEILSLLNKVGFVMEDVQIFDPILPAFTSKLSLGSLFVITVRKQVRQ